MQKQVFQTTSKTRWKSFLWFIRLAGIFLLLISSSVVISLMNKSDYDLSVLTYKAKKMPDLNAGKSRAVVAKKDELDFARHLEKFRKKRPRSFYQKQEVVPREVRGMMPVRAGFYVNWDLNSATSLHKNISKLNMVIPEWLFLANTKGKVESRIEEETLQFILKSKVPVLPILSNYYKNRWNGDSTYLALKNPVTRKRLIDQIKTAVDTNDFKGINIDFENLPAKINPYLLQFSKELHAVMHEDGYLTSIDINPNAGGIHLQCQGVPVLILAVLCGRLHGFNPGLLFRPPEVWIKGFVLFVCTALGLQAITFRSVVQGLQEGD